MKTTIYSEMTKVEFKALLVMLGACNAARNWAAVQPDQTAQALVQKCPRGDWLLWLAAKLGVDHKVLVFTACQVARTVLRHAPAGETRPLRCIEVVEAWTRGETSIEALSIARDAACDAAYAAGAACDAAGDAAAAAAYAAAAACDAACAADAACDAAAAGDAAYAATAGDACDADAGDAARTANLVESADIVRTCIPWHVMVAAGEGSK